MHAPHNHVLTTSLFLALLTFSAASADDHVIVQWTRSGMGGRYPSRVTEIWMNEASLYIKRGTIVSIERYDLKKRWRFSLEKKRYVEEPLIAAAEQQKSIKDSVAIQRAGWDYDPTYDWSVKETQREDTVGAQRCKLFVAEGEADYSLETIELWVAENLPLHIALFNERVTARTVDFDWELLLKLSPALKKCFVVKSVDKREPPISGTSTTETKATTLESAAPPPKIYEVPEGFQKVNSFAEVIK
jgi:hypothetical protein